MLRKIAIAVAVLIAALLLYASTRPDTLAVARSTSVSAPPERVFEFINDFQNWKSWSPWAKRDPAMKETYSGAQSGVGAEYAWSGNRDVGSGDMRITESSSPNRIVIALHFSEPFEDNNSVEFTLEPESSGTRVTWAMQGQMPFISKLISIFVPFEEMIGKDFESGLASLKALAEQS